MEDPIVIVGGGLAGQILAWKLHIAKKEFKMVDESYDRRPSNVAAGIMNPITGKNYALSWRFPELVESALPFYRKVEGLLGQKFLREMILYRAIPSWQKAQEWEVNSADPLAGKYFGDLFEKSSIEDIWGTSSQWFGKIHGAHQLDIRGFCTASAEFWRGLNRYSARTVRLEELYEYPGMVFWAEGSRLESVLSSRISALHRTKGDVLVIRSEGLSPNVILKDKYFVCPLFKEHIYWVGSNYEHNSSDDSPSSQWYDRLSRFLENHMKVPYEIVDHISAYRPTVVDRKPIVGRLSIGKKHYVYNGLGTKGTTLGPWSADRLMDTVWGDKELSRFIDVNRFLHI